MITIVPSKARRSLSRRAVVGACTVTAIVTAAGVGYAAWGINATGSSEAKAGTAQSGSVTVATAGAALFPGGSAPVHFNVTNPNDYVVSYNNLSFVSATVTVTHATGRSGCLDSHVTLNTVALAAASDIEVAAGGTATAQSVAGAISMVSSAPDGCQGATFSITGTTLSGVPGSTV